MEKEFIPYEQALALKELGFDEPCFTKFENYFNKTKLQPIIATLALNTPYENEYNGYDQKIINDDTKKWFFTGYKNSIKDHNQDILSAPLYQQAFRWFREKYGYFHLFDYQHGDSKINKGFFFNIINIDNEDFFFPEDFENEIYRTYEEVELACLKKLIEIAKKERIR